MQTALLPAAAGFSRSACPTPTWRDSGDAFGRARSACSCTDGPGPSSPFQSSYSTAITAVSGGPRSFRRSRLQALALGQVAFNIRVGHRRRCCASSVEAQLQLDAVPPVPYFERPGDSLICRRSTWKLAQQSFLKAKVSACGYGLLPQAHSSPER